MQGRIYFPVVLTPAGKFPIVGHTMTDEREREIARAAALRDMHRLGLEPVEANLCQYFDMIREALK